MANVFEDYFSEIQADMVSKVIPEWSFGSRYLPNDGAELFEVTDGVTKLVGVFDSDLKRFISVK